MADVDWNMMHGLHKDIKRFKNKMIDFDENRFKDTDYCQWVLLFLLDVVNKAKLMKFYKNKLMQLGYEDKNINKLFYWIMKCDYKFENKIWSFNELMELDLEFDSDMKSTLNYTII